MTDHDHLVSEMPEPNLASDMRQLWGVSTAAVNRRPRNVGQPFPGRYKATLVVKDADLLQLCRYVVLDPVRAGMVKGPRQWRWSRYRAMIGAQAAPPWLETDWLLGPFGAQRSVAGARYVDCIRAGVGQPSLGGDRRGENFPGGERFVDRMRAMGVQGRSGDAPREVPRVQRRGPPARLAQIVRRRADRDAGIDAAYATGGYPMAQIGRHFGVHYSTVSRVLRGRESKDDDVRI